MGVYRNGWKKIALTAGVGGSAWLVPELGHAACKWVDEFDKPAPVSVYTVNNTLPLIVTVPRDAAVGATAWAQQSVSVADPRRGVACDTTENFLYTPSRAVGTDRTIMATDVPGVGFRKYWSSGSGSFIPWGGSVSVGPTNGRTYWRASGTWRLELVKTGPVTPGIIRSGTLLSTGVGGVELSTHTLTRDVTILSPTCAVTTPSVPVPLGEVNVTAFKENGKPVGARPFNIGLNCSGVAGAVHMTLTDSNKLDNRTDKLTLSPAPAGKVNATGVALQILRGSDPVSFGLDSAVASNPNQFALPEATSAAGAVNIPFTARFIQTADRVVAGEASGLATFTMSYQ